MVSNVAKRQTHAERKAQTRSNLVKSAHEVFLERGFHGASLDEIAETAGYSKGAVYSNFDSKDELFLAVFDAHLEQRKRALTEIVFSQERLDDAYHAIALSMSAADIQEPRWTPLLLEFWTYASRQEALRSIVSQRREKFLEVIAGLIEELGRRHRVDFSLPTKEIARGSAALARGMALERLLNPDAVSADLFDRVHTAYVNGLTRTTKDPQRTEERTQT
jgi:Transcriptional regulator